MLRFISSIFCLLSVFIASSVHARSADDVAGRVVGYIDGEAIELPLLRSAYDINIAGEVATVTLSQEFANPYDRPMSAEYLFPINKSAAVYAMRMQVGDEIVRAVIQEKAQAEATFKKAKSEGKAAALLTQHRPNMFTQNVANLMPNLPIKVTISYVQSVPKIDGSNELVVPLVVGPRYQGFNVSTAPEPTELTALSDDNYSDDKMPEYGSGRANSDGWIIAPVPASSTSDGLDFPEEISADRVSLNVTIDGGGVPLSNVDSATHALSVVESDDKISAGFATGHAIGNKDFVLRYQLGGDKISTGVLSHFDERGGFFSMQITPPKVPDEALTTPRELVFVIDTSGSQQGVPFEASKRFMDAALAAMRPDDHFQIIAFENNASHFSSRSVPATARNIRAGRKHVAGLRTGGGTNIDLALNATFDAAQPNGTLRIIVFLTDGQIGDEATVLRSLRDRIGDARLYAFGIGGSVNRYLIDAMAEEGRGYARYVDPTQVANDVAETLAHDLKSPLLTDITIDWGGLDVADVGPQRMPDLFAGNSIRLFGRYPAGGQYEIAVRGKVRGRPASLPIKLTLPSASDAKAATNEAIPLMWARQRIADFERRYAVRDGDPKAIESEITQLGLTHSLQTRYTSFVAVSEAVVNDSGTLSDKHKVAQRRVVRTAAAPRARSVPEPGQLMLLTLLALLGGLFLRARR